MSWSHVQGTGNDSAGSASTVAATFGSSVTAGDLIVVTLASYAGGSATFSVQDNKSTTNYTQQCSLIYTADADWVNIFWFVVPSGKGGTSFTVTATITGSSYPSTMSIDEYSFTSGATVTVEAIGTNSGTGLTGSLASALTFTTGDLVYAGACFQTNGTATQDTGFALRYNGFNAMGVAAEDEVNFGGTSVNPYFTFSNSTNWVVGAIAFNAALPNNPTASGAVTLGGLVVSGAASCFVTPTTWTTQRTGNWSLASNNASSPWYDGGTQTARARIPGSSSNANYDVVTIAASQTLTCDTSVTIGNGNGACLTLNGTSGNLVVNGGITLSLYGGIQHNAVNSVTLNAGAAITFVPAGALQFVWNFTYGGSGGTLVCNGTSGSPCAISTNVSGGAPPAYMATTGAPSGVVGLQTATYTNFSHMGDTAGTGVYTSLNSGSGNVSITNCTFTACSLAGVIVGSGTWTGSYTLSTNTFSSSVPGTTFNYTYGGLAAVSLSNGTSGSMTVTNNYFDGYVGIGACSSAVFQYNVFGSTFFCNSPESWSTSWTTFDSNVIYAWGSAYAGQDLTVAGSFTNNYFLIDDPSVSNPHGIALMWPSAVTTINWTGNIFEFTGTDPTGNMMLFYDAASTSYCYCRENIVLPNAGGVCTGVLCTANGNDTNLRLYVEHNTANIEGQWGTEIGHEQTVVESPNRYQSIRANLYWGTASTGFIANNVDSTTYVDIIPPANACYNGKYLVDLATDGYTNAGASYDSDFSVTPGANDVTANPQFVDSTRNLQSWGSIFWGQSTAANTVAYLANNPSSLIPSLMSWVRAGFVPTNPSFEATGWTGDTSTTDANGTTWPGSTPGFGAMAYHAALATGSGAITLGSLGVSGSGAFGAPSSGAITLGSLTVAGAGAFASPASGAITLGSIIVAGAGGFTAPGSGAVTLGSIVVAGSATTLTTALGTITLGPLIPVGTGNFIAPASGAITLGPLIVSGAGSSSGVLSPTASGAITLGSIIVAGAGGFTAPGSGAVTLGSIVVAGSATTLTTALGTITLGPLIPVGTGNFIAPASGAITLGPLIVSGAGSSSGVLSPTASGAITLGSIIVAGAGGFTTMGSGSVALAALIVSGVGFASTPGIASGSGAITLGSLIVAGAGGFTTTVDGAVIQAAIQNWFQSREDLSGLFADGQLHHIEAPEDAPLPYLTFFLISEPEKDGRTTAYYILDAALQFSAHAATDAQAASLRNSVRDAIAGATLSVEGNPVWYCLPGGQQLTVGEGRGPNGSDCWMATVDVSLPYQVGQPA